MLLTSTAVLADEPAVLKDAFAPYFRVGAAISTQQTLGREPAALELASRQFNSVTPENLLKWQSVHPEPGRYDFGPADRYVDWGEKNDMFVVGHTLVWHSQTPTWVGEGVDGRPLDRETALRRMKEHIDTVVGRYKGRIDAWDVVNEAVDDDGVLRSASARSVHHPPPWYTVIGNEFFEKAFEYAHAADPDAELYYNDYNEWYPRKIQTVSRLVRYLQSKDIRIDGIGLQGHWGLSYPTLDEIDHMLTEYGKLGVKLMITELDVSVLPPATGRTSADVNERVAGSERLDPYRDGLPPRLQQALAERYAAIFRVLEKHADKLDRVTFWGIHDGNSWRNHIPVRGRTDYPLLFDRQLRPKRAYESVLRTVSE